MKLSNSFKTRAKVSVGIVLLVIIGAITPDSLGLRIIYGIVAIISACEVNALLECRPYTKRSLVLGALSWLVLFVSAIYVFMFLPRALLIIGIILTMASDTGAYIVGKICGKKIIHASPFPTISPNKSWEGLIGGIIIPGAIAPVLSYLFRDNIPGGRSIPIVLGCLAGLCAIIGDTCESALKRSCGVKDANDILKERPVFRHIEALLGGSEGHGGYYDRLDSMSMVLSVWAIVTVLYILL